jgi:LmbE family N-acetylglucosaminyl deacetylase
MAVDTSGELGSILGIWGHPDDEAYLSAGLMARAVQAGRRVVCVTATRGEAGFPPGDARSPGQRVSIREAEIAASLAVLGVTEHHWLGYPDGGCAAIADDEAADVIAEVIELVRPDTILTFGPDGGTGHPDHVAACRWATLAHRRTGRADTRLLYATKSADWIGRFSSPDSSQFMMVDDLEPEMLPTDELAVWFTCDDDLTTRKVAALRAQASQVEPVVDLLGLDVFIAFVREEFFRDPRPGDREIMCRIASLPPRAGLA